VETKTQDPNYIILDGKLANAHTREIVPDDVPILIIQGCDNNAIAVASFYANICKNSSYRLSIHDRINHFYHFSINNHERMIEPDREAGSDGI